MINSNFILFGTLHQLVIASLCVGIGFVICFRSQSWLKYFLALVLVTQVITFTTYHISNGSYDIIRFLPFHLCTLSAILAPFALLTKSEGIKNLVLFWGLIPALLAIVLPDMGLSDGLYSFRFWEFFVSHIFIVLSAVYLSIHSYAKFSIFTFDTWKRIILAFTTLIIYTFGFVYPINVLLGSNYLYIIKKASNGMDFLPDGQLYLPALITLTFIVFILTAIIYRVINLFKSFDFKN